jgi:hypothetical protein
MPDEAGMGATPACMASLAALAKRSTPATSLTSLADVSTPQPQMARSSGARARTRAPSSPLELTHPGRELGAAAHELGGDSALYAALRSLEPLGAAPEPQRSVQRARGHAEAGRQVVQVLAQPLLDAAALAHQVLAMGEHQRDRSFWAGEPSHGEVRLAERHPGHGQGVDGIGLAAPAPSAAGAGHQLGRYPHHPFPSPEQEALERSGHAAAILEGENDLAAEAARPGHQPLVARRPSGHGQLAEQLGRARVHRAGGVRAAMGVDSD